jgi:hypothetical protein
MSLQDDGHVIGDGSMEDQLDYIQAVFVGAAPRHIKIHIMMMCAHNAKCVDQVQQPTHFIKERVKIVT